jgi:hypothetical protein
MEAVQQGHMTVTCRSPAALAHELRYLSTARPSKEHNMLANAGTVENLFALLFVFTLAGAGLAAAFGRWGHV